MYTNSREQRHDYDQSLIWNNVFYSMLWICCSVRQKSDNSEGMFIKPNHSVKSHWLGLLLMTPTKISNAETWYKTAINVYYSKKLLSFLIIKYYLKIHANTHINLPTNYRTLVLASSLSCRAISPYKYTCFV